MQQFQSQFLQYLSARGFLNQITHPQDLDKMFLNKKICVYIGFDCTAKSLHVGSLIQIMVLQILQKFGHQPIVLLGGGTTKIGDPSGKDKTRQFLDEEKIEDNLQGIKNTLSKFDLSKNDDSLPAFKFVNNDEWLSDLGYIDFLREVGSHFSVNKMLAFDSVKSRLDRQQPLSFLEFNYLILQGYDFYELNKNHDCVLQIGGSDQWGNIVSGVDLIRRISAANNRQENNSNFVARESFGLTTPLLTTADGKKMGKTADGAVWLDGKMLTPFDYYQYFRNIADDDVRRFFKLFTHFAIDDLAVIFAKDINEQKQILAFEATKICHGEEAATEVLEKAKKIFSGKIDVNSLDLINVQFAPEDIFSGKKLTEILRDYGMCESGGAARRLIKGGAVKINDEKITDENYLVKVEENASEDNLQFVLSLSKKKFFKIQIVFVDNG
jgi:tyrosyl-tRNA synthetase